MANQKGISEHGLAIGGAPMMMVLMIILSMASEAHPNPVPVAVVVPDLQEPPPYKGSGCITHRLTGVISERTQCKCRPCWDGHYCQKYVDRYVPKFLVHETTVVVTVNATGTVYRALSVDDDLGLTCPLGPGDADRCPCATMAFQLFSKPGDERFSIDAATGVLSRSSHGVLWPGYTHHYRIIVHSIHDPHLPAALRYDTQDLYVYVTRDEHDVPNT